MSTYHDIIYISSNSCGRLKKSHVKGHIGSSGVVLHICKVVLELEIKVRTQHRDVIVHIHIESTTSEEGTQNGVVVRVTVGLIEWPFELFMWNDISAASERCGQSTNRSVQI